MIGTALPHSPLPSASNTQAGSLDGERRTRRERATRRGARRAPTGRARVVIADDHHLVRAGVKHSLGQVSQPVYEVVAEAVDVRGMVAAVSRRQPDLLLLDVALGRWSALEAIANCVALQPDLAVVVLTAHSEPALVRDAISFGALGYVLKDAEPSELLLALRLALGGASYLAPGLAARLADHPNHLSPPTLSSREREVVRLLALGHTFPEIAAQMNFSERTAKNYRCRAAEALGVSSRVDLTRWALKTGLVSAAEAA
jgi:two-component system, NarL family, response regulator NreC